MAKLLALEVRAIILSLIQVIKVHCFGIYISISIYKIHMCVRVCECVCVCVCVYIYIYIWQKWKYFFSCLIAN